MSDDDDDPGIETLLEHSFSPDYETILKEDYENWLSIARSLIEDPEVKPLQNIAVKHAISMVESVIRELKDDNNPLPLEMKFEYLPKFENLSSFFTIYKYENDLLDSLTNISKPNFAKLEQQVKMQFEKYYTPTIRSLAELATPKNIGYLQRIEAYIINTMKEENDSGSSEATKLKFEEFKELVNAREIVYFDEEQGKFVYKIDPMAPLSTLVGNPRRNVFLSYISNANYQGYKLTEKYLLFSKKFDLLFYGNHDNKGILFTETYNDEDLTSLILSPDGLLSYFDFSPEDDAFYRTIKTTLFFLPMADDIYRLTYQHRLISQIARFILSHTFNFQIIEFRYSNIDQYLINYPEFEAIGKRPKNNENQIKINFAKRGRGEASKNPLTSESGLSPSSSLTPL